MIGNLLGPELKELLRNRDFNGLRGFLLEFPAAD